MQTYVYNRFVDFPQTAGISPSFFALTMDALQNDAIIRTAKLFDKGKKSYGTIQKLFNLVEVNADLFQNEKNRVLKELPVHKKYYEDRSELLQSLLIWRDRHFAHPDKEYFLDRDRLKLGENAPMLYGDLPDLLNKSVEILNFYSEKLYLTHHCLFDSDDPQIEKDVDILFNILDQHLNQ